MVTRSPTSRVARPLSRALMSRWGVPGTRTLTCPLKSRRPSAVSSRMAETRASLSLSSSPTFRPGRERTGLAPGPRQHLDPTPHEGFALGDLVRREELLQAHPVNGVHGPLEVLLVAEGDGGVDGHPSFEAGVHGRPLPVAGREPLLRDEGLARPARDGVEDVGARVDAGREAPDDLVHVVDVHVVVD